MRWLPPVGRDPSRVSTTAARFTHTPGCKTMLPRIHLVFLIIYGATARRNRLPPLGWWRRGFGRVGTTNYANSRSSTLEILSSEILPDVSHFGKYFEPKCNSWHRCMSDTIEWAAYTKPAQEHYMQIHHEEKTVYIIYIIVNHQWYEQLWLSNIINHQYTS